MKRHFSNRGEALSEVTAARVLVNRKASAKASFRAQTDRRIESPFWSLQRVEVRNPPKKRRPGRNEDVAILL